MIPFTEKHESAELSRTAPAECRLTVPDLAEQRLQMSPYIALREVSCELQQGCLILRGRLPSYYLKQLAQGLVADVRGDYRIDNLIDVIAPAQHRAPANDHAEQGDHYGQW